jgi:hypothetical protein
MIGDKDIFVTLKKEKDGSISFGNDNSGKIIGKGIVKLGSKDVAIENFLLIENMKHNLLDGWFGQLVFIDVNPWRVILEIDVNPWRVILEIDVNP